jgi:hypothetical protein
MLKLTDSDEQATYSLTGMLTSPKLTTQEFTDLAAIVLLPLPMG